MEQCIWKRRAGQRRVQAGVSAVSLVSVVGSRQHPPQKGARSQKKGSKLVLTGAGERATGLQANREEIKVSVWVRKPRVMLPRPGSAF